MASGLIHAILIRAWAGEHWTCTCGAWWFDSPSVVGDEDMANLTKEFCEHIEFEGVYGSVTRP